LDLDIAKSLIASKADDLKQDKVVAVQNVEKKRTCFCAQLEKRFVCPNFLNPFAVAAICKQRKIMNSTVQF